MRLRGLRDASGWGWLRSSSVVNCGNQSRVKLRSRAVIDFRAESSVAIAMPLHGGAVTAGEGVVPVRTIGAFKYFSPTKPARLATAGQFCLAMRTLPRGLYSRRLLRRPWGRYGRLDSRCCWQQLVAQCKILRSFGIVIAAIRTALGKTFR
jgi:hypothetical protein